MKALVFGGAGFLGSHVADALSEASYTVTVFDKECSPYIRPNQKMIVGDILDERSALRRAPGRSGFLCAGRPQRTERPHALRALAGGRE